MTTKTSPTKRTARAKHAAIKATALDRDLKNPRERPSIGVLLCATKDDEVVEYAFARTTSPTLVAEYQTFLPPKELLRAQFQELRARLAASSVHGSDYRRPARRRRG